MGPVDRFTRMKGRILMRRPSRAAGVAVGALAVALTAGAFAFAPASAAVTTVTSSKVPASIRPSSPLRAVGPGPGGFRSTSTTVEQIGLLAGCDGTSTTPVYAPFWEMFPNAANEPGITVNPGDATSLSVYYNKSTRKFTLTFSDTTNGQHFARTRACPAGATCRRNSAETISEAPAEVTGSTVTILPLANFQTASFANVSITNTSGTHRGGLRSSFWNTSKITQVAGNGTNFTITGAPITGGTLLDIPTALALTRNFSDQWQAANGSQVPAR